MSSSTHPIPPTESAASKPELVQSEAYQTRIISSLEEFLPLKTDWDAFLRAANVENLCLTHAWLVQWLQHFPAKELLIIIIQDNRKNWVAVAPLKISLGKQGFARKQLKHLQFIGTQPSVYDWMDIVIAPKQNEASILKNVASAIGNSRWDVLDLQFMRERSQCEALAQALSSVSNDSAVYSETVMPRLALPGTTEEYEITQRKKTRLEVKRNCNRFEKDLGSRPHLEFHTQNANGPVLLKEFVDNHIQYWANRGQKSDFKRFPNLLSFYQGMLDEASVALENNAPKLLFSTLKVNNITLSYQLGFWQGSSYLSHLTNFNQGFRNYSPGTLHMDALVFHALKTGSHEFNFGRGDEPYKRLWTREKTPLWNLRLFRNPVVKGLWYLDHLLKKCLGKTT